MDTADRAIVDRILAGDDRALGELVLAHRRELVFLSLNFVRNLEDAEEIAFSSLVKFYRTIRSFRGECSIRTMLFNICRNLSLNRVKYNASRGGGRILSIDAEVPGAEGEPWSERMPSSDIGPRDSLYLDEMERALEECSSRLEPEHREILARRLEGATYEELSREFGMSMGTVKSRISRARNALRKRFEQAAA